ncbi:tetratricopeptide repeat protein, partial [Sandarakinorhabdus sp.]|uniref:tetratricopeptide repeat protein n=1 Tax=Sandarakinorhabdus sp. TaxID=1916663 RepID=UPI00286E4F88
MTDPQKIDLERIAVSGVEALKRGDHRTARTAFEQVAATGRASVQVWLFLAQACDMADDRPAAMAAIAKVLESDPGNAYALVMGGEIQQRSGDERAAMAWYDRALAAADGLQLPNDLVARLHRADTARGALRGRFEAQMMTTLADAGVTTDAAGPRFAEAISIVSGRSQPHLQQPTSFYFPRLPQVPFFDPADFAWARALADA